MRGSQDIGCDRAFTEAEHVNLLAIREDVLDDRRGVLSELAMRERNGTALRAPIPASGDGDDGALFAHRADQLTELVNIPVLAAVQQDEGPACVSVAFVVDPRVGRLHKVARRGVSPVLRPTLVFPGGAGTQPLRSVSFRGCTGNRRDERCQDACKKWRSHLYPSFL